MFVLKVVGMGAVLVGLAAPAGVMPAAAAPVPASSVVAAAISGDGRYVAYVVRTEPPAGRTDQPSRFLYRRDLRTGATEALLPGSDPTIGPAALSADGNLIGAAGWVGEPVGHALIADVGAGTVRDVSLPLSDLDSVSSVSVSGTGRYVLYAQVSQFLGSQLPAEIYRYDAATGLTSLVSESPAGIADADSGDAAISADGGFAAFTSAAGNLVDRDVNGLPDVFVVSLRTGTAQLVSRGPAGAANGPSTAAGISADGRYVPFTSAASNLTAGDSNGVTDVFVRDRRNGQVRLVSRGPAGPANGPSTAAAISAGGRYVLFTSAASNLVGGDTNGVPDVFVRNLGNGQLRRVSRAPGGQQAAGPSTAQGISADGRRVVFLTGTPGGGTEAYLGDLTTGATTPLRR
ncbi:MAG: hypothetical protein V7637_6428 [Mycobacteriales bacterium]